MGTSTPHTNPSTTSQLRKCSDVFKETSFLKSWVPNLSAPHTSFPDPHVTHETQSQSNHTISCVPFNTFTSTIFTVSELNLRLFVLCTLQDEAIYEKTL